MFKVAIVVGSIRKESMNLKLGKALAKLGQGNFQASFVGIADLPLFNQDLEGSAPAAVTKFKSEIEAADAVLFVTPEYNRSVPGVLKNAIDWGSRPYGKSSWDGKVAAIAGASPGAVGAAVSQNHLRSIVGGFLNMKLLGQPEVYFQFKEGAIADDGTIADDNTRKFLQGFVDRFTAWTETHTAQNAKAA
ncbi:MAG: putative NADPH-dependent reductase [Micavibrio sp.]|nr:putative NADPH-dependent reductase [Micavibrio sp.]